MTVDPRDDGPKGLGDAVARAGVRLVARVAERVLADPLGQEALARAVGLAQRGKARVEEAQTALLKAAGVPGRRDFEDLAKRLARLKRKTRDLGRRLDPAGGGGPRRGSGGGER